MIEWEPHDGTAGLTAIIIDVDAATVASLRVALLHLARVHEEKAAQDAVKAAYWEPCPDSVTANRATARALRAAADSLLPASVASRGSSRHAA